MCLHRGLWCVSCECNTFLIILNKRISYDIALILARGSGWAWLLLPGSIYRWTPRSSRRIRRTSPRSTIGTGSGTASSPGCAACCGHAHSIGGRSSVGRGHRAGRSFRRCPGCPPAGYAHSNWVTPPDRSAPSALANGAPVSGHELLQCASFWKVEWVLIKVLGKFVDIYDFRTCLLLISVHVCLWRLEQFWLFDIFASACRRSAGKAAGSSNRSSSHRIHSRHGTCSPCEAFS